MRWILSSKCFRQKNGSVFDFIGLILALVCVVVGFWFGGVVWNEMKVIPEIADNNVTAPIIEATNQVYESLADNLILALFVGIIIASMISALLSKANPFFLYMTIIIVIILLIVCVPISNWWEQFSQDSAFNGMLVYYPKTNYIFMHLPLMCLLDVVMMLICLFIVMRKRGGI